VFEGKSADTLKSDSLNLGVILKRFEFNNAQIRYAYHDSVGIHQINLDNISLAISDLNVNQDKVDFQVLSLQFNDRKDFSLEEFTTYVMLSADSLNFRKLHLRTLNSEITEADIRINKSKIGDELDLKKLKLNLDLKNSMVSLKDIGMAVPSIKGMDEVIRVAGQLSGTLVDLKGKNIELSIGENTRLTFDVYLNGLPDITSTYLHIDLKQSFADLNELVKVKLPDNFPLRQIQIPANLLNAGIFEYNGNFTGFLSDFVAFGTFRSKWGVLTTDLSFVPSQGDKLKINGRLKTVNFKLGELVQSDLLDYITFNGDVKGLLNQKTHDFSAAVLGKIDSVDVNNYQYRDIKFNGDIHNKRFDGSLLANDPNLKFRFDGEFDLNVPVPVFNFRMNVEKANLKALNLVSNFKKSDISFDLNANFTGSNIDNLAGTIHFNDGSYTNENGVLAFSNFDLKTFNQNEPVLQIRSDFLDADIRGKYELQSLHYSVMQIVSHYLPSAGLTLSSAKTQNNFDFRLALKDINRFTQVLIPELKMKPSEIVGSINSDKNTLVFNGSFPEIQYGSTLIRQFTVGINGENNLGIRNKIEEVSIGDQFKIYNLSLISDANNDVLDSKLVWNNFGSVSYSGSVNTSARFFKQKGSPHIEVSVKPTRLYLADTLWQINSSLVTIDSTVVQVNKLKLSNGNQSITFDGSVADNQDDKLNLLFNQIDLKALDRIIAGGLDLKGVLNGNLSLLDVYHRPLFLADLKIDGLGMLDQKFGDASIQSRWDRDNEEINADLIVHSGAENSLQAYGIYNPAKDSLSIYTNFNHFSILILQPLMGSSFSGFHGDASGKVRIYGSPDHIMHDGALYASNAGLMISDLQVNYNLNDSVKFFHDQIIFPDIRINDDFGNTGTFSGTIGHRSFSKMTYDMTIRSKRIMAFNTTPQINEKFYGKMFGSGQVRITGHGVTVRIDGDARTEKGTDMNISLEYEGDAEEYDFLSFISHGYQPVQIVKPIIPDDSDLQMKFNVEITPEAKAQLIYNSKIGDVIRSQGSGNMQVNIDNDYNILLFGEYKVEQGDYLFTLQNVINKKFEIQQGGTIEWTGDPYDAMIDLNAIYRLKAPLRDLFAGNTTDNIDYDQRVPVLCTINLSKSLNKPEVRFDVELPTVEDRIKDQVLQYLSSDEDLNRQILSLLVFGKFNTPESGVNTNLAGSTASTASELFSNHFSNWLSQISKDFDVGFNYRRGNQITNDEFEVALSTQLFNDRVSINGNIANNSSQRTNPNSSSLVGDADVNVKLTNNGKLQFKAYNHANNNLIYETSPYTQGVGVTYREDFNNFNELWKKIKNIFRSKPAKSRIEVNK
jgi:hypothetical protein